MNYYDIDDGRVKKFFIAIKKDPTTMFNINLDYEDVKELVEVVWEGKCTFIEAVKMFHKFLHEQVKIKNTNASYKFKSVILYDENGASITHES